MLGEIHEAMLAAVQGKAIGGVQTLLLHGDP